MTGRIIGATSIAPITHTLVKRYLIILAEHEQIFQHLAPLDRVQVGTGKAPLF
jgi:hypothetical protein